MNWLDVSQRVLAGAALSRAEGLAVLQSGEDELLGLLQAAFDVRRRYYGRQVNLHVLRNAKSGHCQEDCAYCSQSAVSTSPIERYALQSVEELVAGAREAAALGAVKYCLVISGRGPSARELEVVCAAVRAIKGQFRLHLCVSLGLLDEAQARQLKAAGVDRYNHNLETAERMYPRICSSHTYAQRVATVRAAKAAGLEACCGGIMGLGESLADRVELALALRELQVEAIPVNFFDPRAGTPLADRPRLSPAEALRALALFRLINPQADLRVAGGREACLGAMQPLALFAANSMFTRGYLTTGGQGVEADKRMLQDAGFTVAEFVDA